MGIYDRDYTRKDTGLPWEEDRYAAPSGSPWTVTAQLIVVSVVAFLLQSLFVRRTLQGSVSLLELWFALSPQSLAAGQVWRLVTYAFLHDRYSLFHIIFNMLCLWWFGKSVESIYGRREFLLFYLASAAFAGLSYCLVQAFAGSAVPVVGASGAVMATLMLYALHYPRRMIYVWGVFGVEARWFVAFLVALNVFPMLNTLQGGQGGGTTAYAAHVGGLLFGYLYRKGGWRLSAAWESCVTWARRSWRRLRGPRLSVYVPRSDESEEDPAEVDRRVDELLEKIYQQGEASLTDEERDFLARASRRYRERRTH
ncbi:MAG: rhomboid family intramembrane serine protease [Planctomycetota bacterium]|nr:MAG: rhomboid family intramembrane serine protease [Planctomycetota bacterium]